MPKLIILRGLPASGKSTWADAYLSINNAAIVSRDDLRLSLYNHSKADGTLPPAVEATITELQRTMVRDLLTLGYDVVIDDMNLRPLYVREWRKLGRSLGAEIIVRPFSVTVATAVERNSQRTVRVSDGVIESLARRFLPNGEFLPVPEEESNPKGSLYVPPVGKPKAIIVDIDGTVALMSNRNPYDLSRVHEDVVNKPVAEIVRWANQNGWYILFCSGRDSSSRVVTLDWLVDNLPFLRLQPVDLFMRDEGDRRKDSIVKMELFDNYIRHHYDVQFVLDDRQQVVDMWRSLGLTTLQVAEGNF